MSELNENKAQNVVASGNGWSVSRSGAGFDVRITREDGTGFFGTDVPRPATDKEREDARDRLLDVAQEDGEMDRIEEAFAAPWVQA